MRQFFFVLLCMSILFSCSNNKKLIEKKENKIEVEINRNVETLGIISMLVDGEDLLKNGFPESAHLLRFNLNQFKKYANHPAVIKANELLKKGNWDYSSITFGVEYSLLPEFKINPHLNGNQEKKIISSIEESERQEFYKLVKDFYNDAKLDSFFYSNQKVYDEIYNEVNKSLPDSNYLRILEKYHGIKLIGYKIIPSLFVPNYFNFGHRVVTDSGSISYYVMGPAYDIKIDSSVQYLSMIDSFGFKSKNNIMQLGVHEFSHSFVRFLDKPINKKLVESISFLNTAELSENMKSQGYGGNWASCFEEHLVRLCEIRIAKASGNTKLEKEIYEKYAVHRKFIYLPMMNQIIDEYENNRNKYEKLEDFLPVIIEKLKTKNS